MIEKHTPEVRRGDETRIEKPLRTADIAERVDAHKVDARPVDARPLMPLLMDRNPSSELLFSRMPSLATFAIAGKTYKADS